MNRFRDPRPPPPPAPPRVLTVAGSDSGGGAGIQADLKTMLAARRARHERLTAVTAQNSLGVHGRLGAARGGGARPVPRPSSDDIGVQAVKTGMLASAALAATVAGLLAGLADGVPVVVDPVGVSKHGDALLRRGRARRRPRPPAAASPPSPPPTSTRSPSSPASWSRDEDGMRGRRRGSWRTAPAGRCIKGGHLPGGTEAADLLTDGTDEHWYRAPRQRQPAHPRHRLHPRQRARHAPRARRTRARRRSALAKAYVTGAIAAGFPLGAGIGPVDHGWRER